MPRMRLKRFFCRNDYIVMFAAKAALKRRTPGTYGHFSQPSRNALIIAHRVALKEQAMGTE